MIAEMPISTLLGARIEVFLLEADGGFVRVEPRVECREALLQRFGTHLITHVLTPTPPYYR